MAGMEKAKTIIAKMLRWAIVFAKTRTVKIAESKCIDVEKNERGVKSRFGRAINSNFRRCDFQQEGEKIMCYYDAFIFYFQ